MPTAGSTITASARHESAVPMIPPSTAVRDAEAAQRLRRLVERNAGAGSLAEGALLIAREHYPDLDIDHYLARLDTLGAMLKVQVPDDADDVERILVLNRFLFEEQGFGPNQDDFADPRNSFLNEVLERRVGIPITLSIVYIEVGRRIGLALDGLSFPQHFLVKCALPDGAAVLDPFLGGVSLSIEALQRRLGALRSGHRPSRAEVSALLVGASRREILARVLRNLKAVYLGAEQYGDALVASDRLLMLTPTAAPEVRDRGWLYHRLDCFRAALADYRRYLELAPLAADADEVRGRIIELEVLAARVN
jgi:regulator of sirC expression with transglutaminase-like and TPR domain